MREIKFRAWEKEDSKMIDSFWFNNPRNAETDETIMMQYTGLKDKNGREIYESDIVKWERIVYTDCSRSEIDYVDEPIIGEIYYVDGITIGIKEADGTGRILFPFHLLDNSQDFEVLGNIYESKDLLTTP